jgi:hypothetical protein
MGYALPGRGMALSGVRFSTGRGQRFADNLCDGWQNGSERLASQPPDEARIIGHMNTLSKPRMPILIITGFALTIMAGLSALLSHPHGFQTSYVALGFWAVITVVWLWKRRSPNA